MFTLAWTAAYFALAPDPVALFEKNWIFIPVGFCGAVLGNISAVGGGIVFIPVMIFLFKLPPVTALKIALASQCFGMTSGAIGWIQKRVIPFRALKLTVPGLLLGSAVGSLVIHPSALLVKLLFGPVSIILGILTIVLSKKQSQSGAQMIIPPHAAFPLVVISIIGGLITGWIAIGEGELVAALLMLVYGVNVPTCIGLGVMLLSINSLFPDSDPQLIPRRDTLAHRRLHRTRLCFRRAAGPLPESPLQSPGAQDDFRQHCDRRRYSVHRPKYLILHR